jgi:hypothetical protein
VVLMRGAEEIRVHVPRGLLGVQVREIAPEHLIDSDAVVIGGFGHLGWGQGMENSFLGCVMLLEGKYGAKLSYADIVGLSGYGFRVHFYPGFCFSSVDATCGRDIGGEILTRLGYEFEVFSLPDSDEASQDEMAKAKEHLLKKVKTSIDSGWPVIAINLIDADEWGVIAGYQKNGGELFCRTYFDLTEGYEIAQNVPWTIYAIKGKRKIKLGDEYRRSLSVAKELSERDNYGKYGNGTNAVILWMKILQDDEFFNSMDQRKLYTTMHMNWWIYHSLAEARALNGQFLMANKKRFDVDEKAIEDLVKLMEKESTLLANNLSSVPSLWEYENASVWTRDLRKQQVETLADFLELEKSAQQILRAEL